MKTEPVVGLLGAAGVLAVMLLGLWWIVRGLIPKAPGSTGGNRRPFGAGMAGFLSAALLFKFAYESYLRDHYDLRVVVPLGLVLVAGVALVPALETLVSVMAITVFLMFYVAELGVGVLGLFTVMLAIFLGVRRFATK